MHRRHPISTRTDTPIPYTALFRSPNRLATTATLPMPSPSLASLIRKGAMRGFTLIELLVTLVIVALLATAAAPMMQLTAKRAKEHELRRALRSEEHTSELQSLMRISYAVFCLKNKKNKKQQKEDNLISNKQIIKVTRRPKL